MDGIGEVRWRCSSHNWRTKMYRREKGEAKMFRIRRQTRDCSLSRPSVGCPRPRPAFGLVLLAREESEVREIFQLAGERTIFVMRDLPDFSRDSKTVCVCRGWDQLVHATPCRRSMSMFLNAVARQGRAPRAARGSDFCYRFRVSP